MFNARAIEPLGEALPNTEIFRRLAAKMKLDFPELQESDETMMRQAITKMPFTLSATSRSMFSPRPRHAKRTKACS